MTGFDGGDDLRRIETVLFDLGDTLIVEIEGAAIPGLTAFEPIDGVRDVLSELNRRFKLGIVSNTLTWGDEAVERALESVGLLRYFDAVVTSVDAGYRKPHAEIFRKALGILGAEAQRTIMVGDRVDTDVLGANLAGMTSILCRWNDRYPARIDGGDCLPDFIIGSIGELPALLRSLDGR